MPIRILPLLALFSALALAGGCVNAGRPERCELSRSAYALDDGSGWTLVFQPEQGTMAGVRAVLTSPTSGRTWTFGVTESNGYSTTYLLPELADPVSGEEGDEGADAAEEDDSIALYPFDAAMKSRSLIGEAEAPAALFAPDLGLVLWYGTMVDGEREVMDRAFFRLSDCIGG